VTQRTRWDKFMATLSTTMKMTNTELMIDDGEDVRCHASLIPCATDDEVELVMDKKRPPNRGQKAELGPTESLRSSITSDTDSSISNIPEPLVGKFWDEPDPTSFNVRGKTYMSDNRKIKAGMTLFRLIATDIVESDASIRDGICNHPHERVQLALAREKEQKAAGVTSDTPPFIVCINIIIPGPPVYHTVFYYAVDDLSMINGMDGTPSSKLANEFFFTGTDEFRHKTFKLIPRIAEGPYVVKKAVGTKPAIMGTKLKQTYVRGERFFEIVLDCGSDRIASKVIKLCRSYAKNIKADICFLLEGYDESTLPEQIFGCVSLVRPDFKSDFRSVSSGVD